MTPTMSRRTVRFAAGQSIAAIAASEGVSKGVVRTSIREFVRQANPTIAYAWAFHQIPFKQAVARALETVE